MGVDLAASGSAVNGLAGLFQSISKGLRFPPGLEERYRQDTLETWVGPFQRLLVLISVLGFISQAAMLPRHAYLGPPAMQAVFLCPVLCLFASLFLELLPKPKLHFALFAATQILLVSGMTFSAQFCPEPLADRRMMAMGLFVFAQNIFLPLPIAVLAALTLIQIIAFDGIVLSGAGLYSLDENIDLAIQTSGFMALSFLGYQLIEKERRRAWYHNEGEKQKALELAIANKKLQELSNTDGLTGVGNRRCLDQVLELSWNKAAETQRPLSFLMLDIDHFKKLNDTLGHGEGDICLREIGQTLFRNTRHGIDHVARYGGEEFVVILPEMGSEAAFDMAERIRTAIEHLPLKSGWKVTASLGVASTDCVWPGDSPEAMLRRADSALYHAKSGGRNKTVLFAGPAGALQNQDFFEGGRPKTSAL